MIIWRYLFDRSRKRGVGRCNARATASKQSHYNYISKGCTFARICARILGVGGTYKVNKGDQRSPSGSFMLENEVIGCNIKCEYYQVSTNRATHLARSSLIGDPFRIGGRCIHYYANRICSVEQKLYISPNARSYPKHKNHVGS